MLAGVMVHADERVSSYLGDGNRVRESPKYLPWPRLERVERYEFRSLLGIKKTSERDLASPLKFIKN